MLSASSALRSERERTLNGNSVGAMQNSEDCSIVLPSAVRSNRLEAQPGGALRSSDILAKSIVHFLLCRQNENVGVGRNKVHNS